MDRLLLVRQNFKWNFKLRKIPVGDQIQQQRTFLSFPERQLSPRREPFPQDQALQHLIFQIACRTSPTVGTRRHCCLRYAPNNKNLANVHVPFLHKICSCLCIDYYFQNKVSSLYPLDKGKPNQNEKNEGSLDQLNQISYPKYWSLTKYFHRKHTHSIITLTAKYQ